jgi:hypothetical protein
MMAKLMIEMPTSVGTAMSSRRRMYAPTFYSTLQAYQAHQSSGGVNGC